MHDDKCHGTQSVHIDSAGCRSVAEKKFRSRLRTEGESKGRVE